MHIRPAAVNSIQAHAIVHDFDTGHGYDFEFKNSLSPEVEEHANPRGGYPYEGLSAKPEVPLRLALLLYSPDKVARTSADK